MSTELTPTAWSILGFLSVQERSGYEIKRAAQRSVRLFWGVSDPQLYPQLRALAEAGLIEPAGRAEISRSRQRWRLTASGRRRLHEWLADEPATLQMRDEGLVKILFADALGPAALAQMLHHRRAVYVDLLRHIETITPGAYRPVPDEQAGLLAPALVHRYALDFARAQIRWCDEALTSLSHTATDEGETP